MPPEIAQAMAASLPRGRFVEIRAAGHPLLLERPDTVAKALRTWLERDVAGNP